MLVNYKDKLKCKCGKWASPDSFNMEGFKVRGWKCRSCGEGYYDLGDLEPVLELNKLKKEGLQGKVSKDGNSYAIRIPKKLFEILGLRIGDVVNISINEPKKLIVAIP